MACSRNVGAPWGRGPLVARSTQLSGTDLRQRLRELVDQLPEEELQAAHRYLQYLLRVTDPVFRALLSAPATGRRRGGYPSMHYAIVFLARPRDLTPEAQTDIRQACEECIWAVRRFLNSYPCPGRDWDYWVIGGRWSGVLRQRAGLTELGDPWLDNVVPLDQCWNAVVRYCELRRQAIQEACNELRDYLLEQYPARDVDFRDGKLFFLVRQAYLLLRRRGFAPDVIVYNITHRSRRLPRNPARWYAVMVDMHV